MGPVTSQAGQTGAGRGRIVRGGICRACESNRRSAIQGGAVRLGGGGGEARSEEADKKCVCLHGEGLDVE